MSEIGLVQAAMKEVDKTRENDLLDKISESNG